MTKRRSLRAALRGLERDLGRPMRNWRAEDRRLAATLVRLLVPEPRLRDLNSRLGKQLRGRPRAQRPRLLSTLAPRAAGGQVVWTDEHLATLYRDVQGHRKALATASGAIVKEKAALRDYLRGLAVRLFSNRHRATPRLIESIYRQYRRGKSAAARVPDLGPDFRGIHLHFLRRLLAQGQARNRRPRATDDARKR